MNPKMISTLAGIGAGIGTVGALGLGVAATKGASKLTGKPVGMYGSTAHILTNDKLEKQDKKEILKEVDKQQLKDLGKIGGLSALTAGGAVIAAGCSKKALNGFKNIKNSIASMADKIKIGGKSLAQKVADTGLYKKIKTLPAPAKAGIMAGAAILATLGMFLPAKSIADASRIEAKAEAKAEVENVFETIANCE